MQVTSCRTGFNSIQPLWPDQVLNRALDNVPGQFWVMLQISFRVLLHIRFWVRVRLYLITVVLST